MLEGPHELSPDIFAMSQTTTQRGIEVTPAPITMQSARTGTWAAKIADTAFK
jgi:hypothetical protein